MKVAIYCRLSEEDKNKKTIESDSESIKNQKALLCEYAKRQNWEICEIYSDDDYAGADRRRPAFNRLLSDAQAKKFDIVLCKTQSRFTREMELVEKYIHGLFPLWGIRFVSVADNADTENKGNKKARQINGLINEWYLEDMSENIRCVLTNKRENGFHIGSFALYGYRKDPSCHGHLIVDEEAASIVREVFSLFAKGYGKTAIARILNERGIPSPTEYKRLHGLRYQAPSGKTGTLWKYSAIAKMLTNEMYIGNMVQGKYGSISYKTKENRPRPKSEWYIVKNTHEPIIERALWDTVQAMLAQKTKPHATGKIGVFAGKVYCGHCGYLLRSSKSRGKTYLRCPTRYVSKEACEGAFISAQKLETLLITEINRFSEKYLDKEKLSQIPHLESPFEKDKEAVQKTLSLCRKKEAEYSKALCDIYLDKSRGLLCEADFTKLAKVLSDEREKNIRTAQKNEDMLQEIEKKQSAFENQGFLEKYTTVTHLTRELADALIERIFIGKRIAGTKNVPVEIHWKF